MYIRRMDTLKAIAEPRRREILRLVWTNELPAGEIASHFSVSRPAISQHLRVLKDAGLIAERREGTRRLYTVHPTGIEGVRGLLERLWEEQLSRLKAVAEQAEGASRD